MFNTITMLSTSNTLWRFVSSTALALCSFESIWRILNAVFKKVSTKSQLFWSSLIASKHSAIPLTEVSASEKPDWLCIIHKISKIYFLLILWIMHFTILNAILNAIIIESVACLLHVIWLKKSHNPEWYWKGFSEAIWWKFLGLRQENAAALPSTAQNGDNVVQTLGDKLHNENLHFRGYNLGVWLNPLTPRTFCKKCIFGHFGGF